MCRQWGESPCWQMEVLTGIINLCGQCQVEKNQFDLLSHPSGLTDKSPKFTSWRTQFPFSACLCFLEMQQKVEEITLNAREFDIILAKDGEL